MIPKPTNAILSLSLLAAGVLAGRYWALRTSPTAQGKPSQQAKQAAKRTDAIDRAQPDPESISPPALAASPTLASVLAASRGEAMVLLTAFLPLATPAELQVLANAKLDKEALDGFDLDWWHQVYERWVEVDSVAAGRVQALSKQHDFVYHQALLRRHPERLAGLKQHPRYWELAVAAADKIASASPEEAAALLQQFAGQSDSSWRIHSFIAAIQATNPTLAMETIEKLPRGQRTAAWHALFRNAQAKDIPGLAAKFAAMGNPFLCLQIINSNGRNPEIMAAWESALPAGPIKDQFSRHLFWHRLSKDPEQVLAKFQASSTAQQRNLLEHLGPLSGTLVSAITNALESGSWTAEQLKSLPNSLRKQLPETLLPVHEKLNMELEALQRNRRTPRDHLTALAKTSPNKLLEMVDALADAKSRSLQQLREHVMVAWASGEPNWDRIPEKLSPSELWAVWKTVPEAPPAQLEARIQNLSPADRQKLGKKLSNRDPFEEAINLENALPLILELKRDTKLNWEGLTDIVIRTPIEQTLPWTLHLTQEELAPMAGRISEHFMFEDSEKISIWARDLPPGPAKDQASLGIVSSLSRPGMSPQQKADAQAWLFSIHDPKIQIFAKHRLFTQLTEPERNRILVTHPHLAVP